MVHIPYTVFPLDNLNSRYNINNSITFRDSATNPRLKLYGASLKEFTVVIHSLCSGPLRITVNNH